MKTKHHLYAVDAAFFNSSGVYDFQTQCEILKLAGYDGIIHAAWDGRNWNQLAHVKSAKEDFGIDVSGLYVILDLSQGVDHPGNRDLLKMLETVEGTSTFTVAIKTAGGGNHVVCAWLSKALEVCERRGLELLLYPHMGFWMDKHQMAIELCEKLNHQSLGIVFTGYHWYALEGDNPRPVLEGIYPWLRMVHLTGSRHSPLGFGGKATFETLDSGEMDNLAVIGVLKNLGYEGPFGYQGWLEGGNPYNKVKRSYDALVEMIELAEQNPHWFRHLG